MRQSGDLLRALMQLEALLPAASYGASVAAATGQQGYSTMAKALKDGRRLLAELRPGALVCRQADHPFLENPDGTCTRCGQSRPPSGPFTWSVDDLKRDRSWSGAANTEKGAKNACTRAVEWMSNERGNGLAIRTATLRDGLRASITAPDGRRWEVDPDWRGGCSWWREAVPGAIPAPMTIRVVVAQCGPSACNRVLDEDGPCAVCLDGPCAFPAPGSETVLPTDDHGDD